MYFYGKISVLSISLNKIKMFGYVPLTSKKLHLLNYDVPTYLDNVSFLIKGVMK
jgi:hypothetical protein